MKFVISEEVANKFPDLRIGVMMAKGINNREKMDELEDLKHLSLMALREKHTLESLRDHPYIITWRETYRSFGAKPKKYTPTAENFIRRLLEGNDFFSINVAVDAYLVIETEFFLPIGGYDLDNISGDIELRISDGREEFVPLGGKDTSMTKPNEIIYSDEQRVLTRRWNYRDCDHTKITTQSKNIALFSEAPTNEIPTSHLTASIEKLSEYLNRFCGGAVTSIIIDVKEGLEWEI